MQCNYHFLVKVVSELKPKLLGLALTECFSQERDQLVLRFENDSGELSIKAHVSREFSCLAFYDNQSRKGRNSVDLFSDALNHEVVDVLVLPYSRGVVIHLDSDYVILLKLFGAFSNVVLLRSNQVVGIFNNNIKTDFELDLGTMQGALENLPKDPLYWRTIIKELRCELENIKDLDDRLLFMNTLSSNDVVVVSHKHSGPVLSLLPLKGDCYLSALEASTVYLHKYLRWRDVFRLKHQQVALLKRELKKTKGYVLKNQKALDSLLNQVSHKEKADVIMANLHAIPHGVCEVELLNFYTGKMIHIALKPELSAQQQAQKLYRKYKNANIQFETLEKNIEAALKNIVSIENEIEEVESEDDLKVLKKRLKSERKEKDEVPFKVYEKQGFKILVGRNSKNNDLLTLKYATKQDCWLHAKDVSGSHVVIKDQPGKNLPESVKLFAASLAAANSKRSGDTMVPVTLTRKKFVRKPKGYPPGAVKVEREEVVLIEPFVK